MLITFKSKASGDVIMLGQNGREMLAVLGKDADASQGIFTVDQLPGTIILLQQAIAADKARRWDPAAAARTADPGVRLSQRALPVLDLLQRSLKRDVPVTWGV
jgi:hypothetical protein